MLSLEPLGVSLGVRPLCRGVALTAVFFGDVLGRLPRVFRTRASSFSRPLEGGVFPVAVLSYLQGQVFLSDSCTFQCRAYSFLQYSLLYFV